MGISTSDNSVTYNVSPSSAFSEHILKIEKLGPDVSFKSLPTCLSPFF
jgi:hypothetical protein